MPNAANVPGAITFMTAGRAALNGDSFGIRSSQYPLSDPTRPGGAIIAPAARTPGSRLTSPSSPWKNARLSLQSAARGAARRLHHEHVVPAESERGSLERHEASDEQRAGRRRERPPARSRATTSPSRVRLPRPPATRPALWRSGSLTSMRAACSAGGNPNRMLTSTQSANVKRSTLPLTPTSSRRGTSGGESATSVPVPQIAISTPIAAGRERLDQAPRPAAA